MRGLLRGDFEGTRAEGWLLYGASVALEALLGGTTRWLLVYFGAGALPAAVVPGPSALWAWLVALVPFGRSAAALLRPAAGEGWERGGAHLATVEERGMLLAGLVDIWLVDWQVTEPDRWYVVDAPVPAAATRGRDVLVTTGLLRSPSLSAVLAHELGHVHAVDTRLTAAAGRLLSWSHRPLLRPAGLEATAEPPLPLFAAVRLLLGLAGGGVSVGLMEWRWHAYRYAREYAADAYAASLGQARPLIRFLTAVELSPQAGALRLLGALSDHPLPRSRIARLRRYVVANYPLRSRPLHEGEAAHHTSQLASTRSLSARHPAQSR